VVAASLTLVTIAYAPFALTSLPHAWPRGEVTASVLVLGVVCTAAAFLIFFALIAEVGPVLATVITYVNPAVAVVIGALFLHEHISASTLVGFALILAGSFLATRPPRLAEREHPELAITGAVTRSRELPCGQLPCGPVRRTGRPGWCMTSSLTHSADRAGAQEVLALLAGESAVLRDDQWRAIEALLSGSGCCRTAHRLGQERGLLHGYRTHAGPRRRPHPHRQPAAGVDAQPAGGGLARGHPRRDHQFRESRRVGRVEQAVEAGEVDVLLISPERLNSPGSGRACCRTWRSGAGCWWSMRRIASPTGVTISGRTTGGFVTSSTSCPRASRCWPPPLLPTSGSP